MTDKPSCDGLCVTAADIGIPSGAVAYPHPGCPLHSPELTCECGHPDRCLSPTHGQVSMAEARRIRNCQHRLIMAEDQKLSDGRCGCSCHDCCVPPDACCEDCEEEHATAPAFRTEPTRED